MKDIIVLSVIIILSSCKKEYVCYCHSGYPLDEREKGVIINNTYFKAKQTCESYEVPYYGYPTTCKLN